jgi:hypothetical protein
MVRYEDRYDNFHQWSTYDFLLTFDFLPTLSPASSALVVDVKRPLDKAIYLSFQFRLQLDNGEWELARLSGPSLSPTALDNGVLSSYTKDHWAEPGTLALGDQFSILLDGRPLTYQRDTARLDRATVDPPNEVLLESSAGLTEVAIDDIRLWDLDPGSIYALGQNWAQDLAPLAESVEGTGPTFSDDFSSANLEWGFDDPDFIAKDGQMKLSAIGSIGGYGDAGPINAKDFMLQFDFAQGSG